MQDISAFIDNQDRQYRLSVAFLVMSGSDLTGQTAILREAEDVVDDLAFLAALTIESNPHATTPGHLRILAEDVAKRIGHYARAIRERNSTSPEPISAMFGVENSISSDAMGAMH